MDIGGTKMLALAVDEQGAVHGEERLPTPDEPSDIIDGICSLVEQVAPGATAVAIGIAGLIGRDGQIRVSPHIPFAAGYDIVGAVSAHLSVPVTIDNDANVAAWGEAQAGAGRGKRDLVLVTLGTGIGTGLVCNGTLVHGHHGFGGEAGHIVVDRVYHTSVRNVYAAGDIVPGSQLAIAAASDGAIAALAIHKSLVPEGRKLTSAR